MMKNYKTIIWIKNEEKKKHVISVSFFTLNIDENAKESEHFFNQVKVPFFEN